MQQPTRVSGLDVKNNVSGEREGGKRGRGRERERNKGREREREGKGKRERLFESALVKSSYTINTLKLTGLKPVNLDSEAWPLGGAELGDPCASSWALCPGQSTMSVQAAQWPGAGWYWPQSLKAS